MKHLLITSLLLIKYFVAFGESLDETELLCIAREHFGTVECSIVKKTKAYCIVQNKNKPGFAVILSVDNEKNMLIGYADSGDWDESKMPPALMCWLNHLDSKYLASNSIKKPTNSQSEHVTIQRKDIPPLLSCHWHQDSPYNDLSPIITDGNVKTAAGCVAIAAAQIAYYWRKDNPESTLEDTPVYPYGAAPVTMSIPEGSPNNWELMKDSYTGEESPESRYAAAQLCYVIGTTSYLNYASSTGGQINDASNALYSQYNISSEYTRKGKYSQSEWEDLIYHEIINGRPVLCAGNDGGGHAFVLDGYDSQNDLYHFNFGWGGSGDGYYSIDDSEEAMGGYYMNQSIVYNIQPMHRNVEAFLTICNTKDNEMYDVTIDVTNKSTLAIKCLKLFIVPEDKTLDDIDYPIWQKEITIECDSVHQQITAYNVTSLPKQDYCLYLTDENKFSLCYLSISPGNNIKELWISPTYQSSFLYDINGHIIKHLKNGIFIYDTGEKKRKIIIK